MTSSENELYYEYIVLGCGGVGSGTLYWLSKKVGKNVLGIEQFELGHGRGGSQDVSRMIRLMYSDERYTKLAPHTYDAWRQVEKESGIKLIHITGGLDVTRKGCPREGIMQNLTKAMDSQNIKYDILPSHEIKRRFPQFRVGDDVYAVYQADGGIVDAALANAVHIQLARGNGATIIDQCPVVRLEPTADGGAKVYTPKGVFRCRRVIVTAGAWINHVLGTVGVHVPVVVTQEQVSYYGTPNMRQFTIGKFPIMLWHDDEMDFYAIPIYSNSGFKFGIDSGGPVVTADTRSFDRDPVREKACTEFLNKNIPEAAGPVLFNKSCLYTMPKDRHFIIDTLASRGMPQIVVCCGAAHIYKFASFMGKVLTELAMDGKTQYDISGFSIDRDAITDPTFKQTFKVTYNPNKSRM